jgi:hypothetical protein
MTTREGDLEDSLTELRETGTGEFLESVASAWLPGVQGFIEHNGEYSISSH